MLTTEHIEQIWCCPRTWYTMVYPQMASHSSFDYFIIFGGNHWFRFVPMKRQPIKNPYLCMLYLFVGTVARGYDCEAGAKTRGDHDFQSRLFQRFVLAGDCQGL